MTKSSRLASETPDRGPVYEVTSETEGPTVVPFDVVSGPGGWMSDRRVLGRVK